MLKNYIFLALLLVISSQIVAQDDHSFQWRYESALGANMFQLDVLPLAAASAQDWWKARQEPLFIIPTSPAWTARDR